MTWHIVEPDVLLRIAVAAVRAAVPAAIGAAVIAGVLRPDIGDALGALVRVLFGS